MITLPVAPLQVGVVIVLAVAVLVQYVGKAAGVGNEGFGYEAVYLECLALQADAAVALAVVGGYQVPRSRTALRVGSAEYGAVLGDEIEGLALLPELLVVFSHIAKKNIA